jgi:pyruvate/2-oxoglutarate dehydrogenase complex dihydrolipoamide acyltransferase (E2) component
LPDALEVGLHLWIHFHKYLHLHTDLILGLDPSSGCAKRQAEAAARRTMALACAFDHRIVDGAQVAAFPDEFRDRVESPELALLDL